MFHSCQKQDLLKDYLFYDFTVYKIVFISAIEQIHIFEKKYMQTRATKQNGLTSKGTFPHPVIHILRFNILL